MRPGRLSLGIPATGFAPLGLLGHCAPAPPGRWVRATAGAVELFVHAEGPSGSGRFWGVTVGVGGRGTATPARGFCLEANTAGWRTLQRFARTPLPWLADLDADGRPELVLWDSFSLAEGEATHGLVAWTYQLAPEGVFVHDARTTRVLARELSQAYRIPLEAAPVSLRYARARAALELEALADGRCIVHAKLSERTR